MKLEHTMSTTVTHETYRKAQKIIAERLLAGEKASSAIILRQALEMYLANGNSAPAQDTKTEDKPDDKTEDNPTPTSGLSESPSSNPFSDLTFD